MSFRFPTKSGGEWELSRDFAREMAASYPDLDIPLHLKRARTWLIANPAKRKTDRGMPRFLNGWMSRQSSGKARNSKYTGEEKRVTKDMTTTTTTAMPTASADEHAKTLGMNTSMVVITPALAIQWLECNELNRKINEKRVRRYAKEMISGEWHQSHQGIGFYEDGSLADGQHRLTAIVKANVSVPMPVTWGVPKPASIAIDTLQPRTANQVIRLSGEAPWIGQVEVSITNFLIRLYRPSLQGVSPQDVLSVAQKHRDIVNFGASCFAGTKTGITTAAVRTALGVVASFEGEEKVKRFCQVLQSGMPDCESEKSAIVLREYLIRESSKANSSHTLKSHLSAKVMRAARSFTRGEEIRRVSPSITLPYIVKISR